MALFRNGHLYLYGYVGADWSSSEEGFTAAEVVRVLDQHEPTSTLVVHVNSGGGIVDEGTAIYNALASVPGPVRVEIDGIAASSASIIAMAGDEIIMRTGSLLMIHDPSNITYGNAAEHAKTIEQLEAYGAAMASIYATRTKKSVAAIRALMKAETWFDEVSAVREGFATGKTDATAVKAAAFDYRAYAHAPKHLRATSHAWGKVRAGIERDRGLSGDANRASASGRRLEGTAWGRLAEQRNKEHDAANASPAASAQSARQTWGDIAKHHSKG